MTLEATGGPAAAMIIAPELPAITMRLVTDKAEWDGLVRAAPMPHLPQDFAYGEGKAATGFDLSRVVLEAGGGAIAFTTALHFKRFGLRLVNRINRGPVFLIEPTDEQVVAVYRAIRNRWGRMWTRPLAIAPALIDSEHSTTLLRRAGYRLRNSQSWQSGRIDLTIGEDALRSRMASTFRNRLRSAEKSGAEVRIAQDDATYEWMIARHSENMGEKGFSGSSPVLLRALRRAAGEDVIVFQMIHDGEPVAGMSVVRFGRHAEYHIGWFGPKGRKLNAGNFLMWNVMRELQRRSVTIFDVGGMRTGDGYTRFKQTMKPDEYLLAGEWLSF